MAPILQCPDCGTKHPLGQVPSQGAFPCAGCGRVLKVPEAVGQRAAAPPNPAPGSGPAPAPAPAPAPGPRPVPVASAVSNPSAPFTAEPAAPVGVRGPRTGPPIDEQALGALAPKDRRPVARLGSVPWWMRLLLWFVAIPLGFLVVFLIARAFGAFTTNQLSDVFLADNTARFWPVARLLPFVALATAAFVQAGVYALARLRGRTRTARLARSSGDVSAAAHRSRAR